MRNYLGRLIGLGLTLLLSACAGGAAPATPAGPPETPTAAALLGTPTAATLLGTPTAEDPLTAAVAAWVAATVADPYRASRLAEVREDGDFARATLYVELRRATDADYQLYRTPLTLVRRAGVWQVRTADRWYSVAGDATATAGAATAIAGQIARSDLHAVTCAGAGECWAVGGSGVGRPAHAGVWAAPQPLLGPVPLEGDRAALWGVALTGPATGWAVGVAAPRPGATGGRDGIVLRLAAGQWTPVYTATRTELLAVACAGAEECWAVGGGPQALLYAAGGVWTPSPAGAGGAWRTVALAGGGEGWAGGGDGTLWRLHAGVWTAGARPTHWPVTGLVAARATDAWATAGVVGYGGAPSQGALLHWDGTDWRAVPGAPQDTALEALVAAGPGDLWIGGRQDTGDSLWHYRAGTWTRAATGGYGQINALALASATVGWAVGAGGSLWQGQAGAWTIRVP